MLILFVTQPCKTSHQNRVEWRQLSVVIQEQPRGRYVNTNKVKRRRKVVTTGNCQNSTCSLRRRISSAATYMCNTPWGNSEQDLCGSVSGDWLATLVGVNRGFYQTYCVFDITISHKYIIAETWLLKFDFRFTTIKIIRRAMIHRIWLLLRVLAS